MERHGSNTTKPIAIPVHNSLPLPSKGLRHVQKNEACPTSSDPL